ncbi:hypothetical protein EYC84_000614 [Monilinia fructicola]|uniref:Ketoreductase (KR) domain-containing protein n=1 Tax=Monilinia fructicola TaxID=38448 RepID=A0A5M9JPW7_MONFR|nr:hypothetical protein EYC84_000614 [Monilinia fructicola]
MSSAVSKRLEALEFARTSPKNLRLILTARRIDVLEEVKKDIEKEVGEGVKVLTVKLDVSKPEEVKGFVGGLPEEWREIDVLVNNAGLVRGVAQAPSIAEEDINIMFATNGDIINIGSIAGREAYQGGSIYCATKAAIRSFGQVETEFSVVRFYGDKEKADAVYAGCEPLTPDDIAEVIVFAAGRRENVVIADTLIFPNHQAAATVLHKKL